MHDSEPSNRQRSHERRLIDAAREHAAGSSADSSSARTAGREQIPADVIPGYRLQRKLHQGGQGVVYLAEQLATHRDVAVKVMREGVFATDADRARFDREVQVLAQLRHPHIVTIHDSGTAGGATGGLAYLVMDLIDGHDLHEHVWSANLSVRQIVQLFAKICEAVSEAHLRGIIHRDLKPGNVRVDGKGEPHVLDFGLAKQDPSIGDSSIGGDGPSVTQEGQFVGSLPWASPEQLEGRHDRIDLRTDVYSLGAMMYQALTGRLPHTPSGSLRATLHAIVHDDPPPPSTLRKGIGDEVQTIVMKCLAKDPARRYQSAGELARDLRRFLANEPIEAKRDSTWYVFKKTLHRYRVAASVAALIGVIVIASTIGLWSLYKTAETERNDAELVNSFLTESFGSANPDNASGPAVPLRAQLDNAVSLIPQRLVQVPRVEATVRDTIGVLYSQLEEFSDAESQLRRALELRVQLLGTDAPQTMETRYHLASVLHRNAQYDEAETLYRVVVEHDAIHEPVGGGQSAEHKAALAWLLKDVGKLDKSEELYRDALAMLEKHKPADARLSVRAMNDLAQLLAAKRDMAGAETLLREAYALLPEVSGDAELLQATVGSNLGSVLRDLGSLSEAQHYLEESLEIRTRRLGESHATVVSMNKLALLYLEQGQYEQGERLFRQILGLRQEVLPGGHSFVGVSLHNLGLALHNLDRCEEAVEYYARAASVWTDAFKNPDHRHVATAIAHQADCLRRLNRLDEARALAEEALRIRRDVAFVNQPDHSAIAASMIILGRVMTEQDQAFDAEAIIRAALPMLENHFGPDNRRVGEAHVALGICLARLARAQDAAEHLELGRRIIVSQQGDQAPSAREAEQCLTQLNAKNETSTLPSPNN